MLDEISNKYELKIYYFVASFCWLAVVQLVHAAFCVLRTKASLMSGEPVPLSTIGGFTVSQFIELLEHVSTLSKHAKAHKIVKVGERMIAILL